MVAMFSTKKVVFSMKNVFIFSLFIAIVGLSAAMAEPSVPFQLQGQQYERIPVKSPEGQKALRQLQQALQDDQLLQLQDLDLETDIFIIQVADEEGGADEGSREEGGQEKEDEPDFKPVPPDPDEKHPGLRDDPIAKRWSYHFKQIMNDFFPDDRKRAALQLALGGAEVFIIGRVVYLVATQQVAQKSWLLRLLGLSEVAVGSAFLRSVPPVLAGLMGVDLALRVYIWTKLERDPKIFTLFITLKKMVERWRNPPKEKYPDHPRKGDNNDEQPDLPFTHL